MSHSLPISERTQSLTSGLPLILIVAITAWRFVIADLLPVTQDEAYYFDWARSLAWGYFDHPPGVALMGAGILLSPGSALLARFGGLIAGAITLWILARFYRSCGLVNRWDLTLALVLVSTTLPGLVGGVITTPDTVLALGWALALHEGERALAGEHRRWLTVGLGVGIGLLGKYTMVLIGPVFLMAIVWTDRKALLTPWPYLGALIALAVFSPNIWWNAQHDWLTMRFQFGHGFSTDVGSLSSAPNNGIDTSGLHTMGERLSSLGEYLGTQAVFWGMLLLPLLLVPWLRKDSSAEARRSPSLRPHARPLLLTATFLPLVFFGAVATFSSVEANWPVMYLLAAAPLAALRLRQASVWTYVAAGVNVTLVGFYALHAATGILPLPDSQNRVLRETHGFEDLAEVAAGLDGPVYADRYQTTAMLRFYRPDLKTTQWPGLTRPSEYLSGRIAPRIDPSQVKAPFWLVSRFSFPPKIEGLEVDAQRTLFDCPGQPLHETRTSPCKHPLHIWHLDHYVQIRSAVDAALGTSLDATVFKGVGANQTAPFGSQAGTTQLRPLLLAR